jgi:hypothetical protein
MNGPAPFRVWCCSQVNGTAVFARIGIGGDVPRCPPAPPTLVARADEVIE